MNNSPQYLECCDELAQYIEQASCAVAVLGDLLEAIPEEDFSDGSIQSLGFLLKILGDGMMQRSLGGYQAIHRYRIQRNRDAEPPMAGQAPPTA